MCMSTHFRYIERTWLIATKRKPCGLYRLPLHDGFQQAETTAQYEPRSIQADRPACTLSKNSQPRLTVFVKTAISRGVRLMNWPKGCPRYIGQCTFSRHEYPGFSMEFRGWITDLIMCVCLHLSFWRPKNFVSPQKRADIQRKTPSLPTTCDTWRCCEVWRLKRRKAVQTNLIWTNRMHYLLPIISIINPYTFRAGLLLIIRRYYSVYTVVLINP